MRSSNKRSRSKSNRPKTLGNIVNRVFDSSGPEGKVRGTPQQIIDKYMLLARDAQLGGDRVAAENFLQHAEHYTRMLSEAQRELAREAETRRDQHQPGGGQNRRADQRDDAEPGMNGETGTEGEGGERRADSRNENRNENRGDNRGEGQGNGQGNRRTGRRDDRHEGRNDGRSEGRRPNRDQRDAAVDAPAVDPREALSGNEDSDSMLVETPESRREQRPVAEATPAPDQPETADTPAGEAPKPRKPRAPAVKRSLRKPKSDEAGAGGAEGPGDAPKAAE